MGSIIFDQQGGFYKSLKYKIFSHDIQFIGFQINSTKFLNCQSKKNFNTKCTPQPELVPKATQFVHNEIYLKSANKLEKLL